MATVPRPRGRAAEVAARGGDALSLRLAARPPFDWSAALEFLSPRALPGVEAVTDVAYLRTVRLGPELGVVRVDQDPDGPGLLVGASAALAPVLDELTSTVARAFDLSASPATVVAHLRADALLEPAVRAAPALRLPRVWDPFEGVVRALLGQRVSVRAATASTGRLAARSGQPFEGGIASLRRLFPDPERVLAADLSGLGLTRRSAAALKAIARAFSGRSVDFSGGLENVVERLQALPGVGPWTAHYVAMRALGEADAFPAGDLVLRRAVSQLLGRPLARGELAGRAERWRPYRAYAVVALWRYARAVGGR